MTEEAGDDCVILSYFKKTKNKNEDYGFTVLTHDVLRWSEQEEGVTALPEDPSAAHRAVRRMQPLTF